MPLRRGTSYFCRSTKMRWRRRCADGRTSPSRCAVSSEIASIMSTLDCQPWSRPKGARAVEYPTACGGGVRRDDEPEFGLTGGRRRLPGEHPDGVGAAAKLGL